MLDRNRTAVTIEQLLVWAYRDQMVDRAQRGKSGLTRKDAKPLAAQSAVWSDTTPIEASRVQGFEAAEDAWRVFDLVVELDRLRVDCGHDLAAARYHALGQYRGADPPIGRVVPRDATMRGPASARPWPTDGVTQIDVPTLVMLHARKATRPERFGSAEWRFKPEDIVWFPKRRGGVYQKGWYQHIAVSGVLPGHVIEAEVVYQAWRAALARMATRLRQQRLTMFAITDVLPAL